MKIGPAEFRRQMCDPKERKINLFFEGMSGVGKSHWMQQFETQFSWDVLDVDTAIAQHHRIAPHLSVTSETDTHRLGKWLGSAREMHYREREQLYLEVEADILRALLATRGYCIALSGSSIYHEQEMTHLQQKNGMIIYLESENSDELIGRYLQDNKPFCWNGAFIPFSGESEEETVRRILPKLIESRNALYRAFADVSIPKSIHASSQNPRELVEHIATVLGRQ